MGAQMRGKQVKRLNNYYKRKGLSDKLSFKQLKRIFMTLSRLEKANLVRYD